MTAPVSTVSLSTRLEGEASSRNDEEERMPDQQTIDRVAGKFQEWASTLSDPEQAAVAEWMTRGQDVQGHSAQWWQGQGAWESAWKESWNWNW